MNDKITTAFFYAIRITTKPSGEKLYLSTRHGDIKTLDPDDIYIDTLKSGNIVLFGDFAAANFFLCDKLGEMLIKIFGKRPIIAKIETQVKGTPQIRGTVFPGQNN